jgi:diadenosine tetraphosphate (Ap4A) HIT family hydrolase
MTFDDLKGFLLNKMVSSHSYQPLLIRALVDSGGSATIRQLATSFVISDERRLLCCEKCFKEMSIKALKRHGVISEVGQFVALNVSKLTVRERTEIKRICEKKIQETGYFKLQGLCSSYSGITTNDDDKDYRSIIEKDFDESCPFCQYNRIGKKPVENEYAFAKPDKEPFKEGHTLIIPKRHVADCFDMSKKEFDAIYDVLRMRRKQLLEADPAIQGFNVGFNSGAIAGQTVFHCHVHLIPRRPGDGEHPRGGSRARKAIE